MSDTQPSSAEPVSNREGLISVAALVVIVFGLQAARSWLVPVCFALLLGVLTSLPVGCLLRLRLPRPLAVLLSLAAVVGAATGLVYAFRFGVRDFGTSLPEYQKNLEQLLQDVVTWLQSFGIEIEVDQLGASIEPKAWLQFVQKSVGGALGLLSAAFTVVITAMFAVWEGNRLHERLQRTFGQQWHEERATSMMTALQVYSGVKVGTSLLTGVLVYVLTGIIGIDGQLLWGLLAFVLNFVPIVGSIFAAVPPVLLTMASPELGMTSAAVMILGYVAINSAIGNLLEPVLMGQQLGMPAFVVMLSLVFWGWLWGAGGMFLAVPLTIVVGGVVTGRQDLSLLRALVGR